ncbi:MAG TPA: cyclic peptide export ABC transporter [Thermoanaerobaculia bacterium]|nr:cyclic peptide export ABC transporter [Thermoanaerobaculia bacterium]
MRDLVGVLRFLLQLSRSIPRSRLVFSAIVIAGIVSGLSNAGLLALINLALNDRAAMQGVALASFFALCLLLPLNRLASRALLLHLANRSVFGFRLQLCRQILSTPLERLESLGPHRLLAIMTEDVGSISMALTEIPLLFMHLAVLAGCLAYLGWLSWKVLAILMISILLGAAAYQLVILRGLELFEQSRRERDHLFHHFRALTQGVKELKLHAGRRQAFVDRVASTTTAVQRYGFRGDMLSAAADSWGHVLFFLVVGLIVIVLPGVREVDRATVSGYALVVLYLITPLEYLLSILPTLSRAKVAIGKVEEIGKVLSPRLPEIPAPAGTLTSWHHLELRGIKYSYAGGEFVLGPLDFTLQPGEIVFLTGGNGSGKTTLAKVLVGLYEAQEGEIRVDGEPVGKEGLDLYRERFSAVFQDFHLFDEFLGLDPSHVDVEAKEWLPRLGLDHKVRIAGGALSTTDLSQGQRKRLALLAAFLEDRPIYVFDEWAADQDAVFREIFYFDLLTHLRRRAKAVCVISHDDRYYSVADRILKLENGRAGGQDGSTSESVAPANRFERSL